VLDPLGDEDEDAPLEGLELAPPAEPLDEPELLGWALELELESLLELGEAELAPPEAEPDFDGSLEAEPDFDGSLEDELLLEEPGELGLDDAPAEGDEDAPLEGDVDDELLEGDELDGEVAEPELEPDEPGLDELLRRGRKRVPLQTQR
jgi:hypothetical protein